MENTAGISFLNEAEKLTYLTYHATRKHSIILSEVISRIAAAILLSTSAAIDIAVHALFIMPTFIYCISKSIYQWKADFNLPWQHLQRVRNAVAPLLLGSLVGVIHPLAGIIVCEPTDKHILLGILSSNGKKKFVTPCSPIHSLSIVEELASKHNYIEKDGSTKVIFSAEHVNVIKNAKALEKSLEALQAQEYIHKITNVTLAVMSLIKSSIDRSRSSDFTKHVLIRLSGVLIPVLTAIDTTIALIVQAIFLTTGAVRIISGRGPIYTEVTTNPLMHAAFLIQNVLKTVGNLIGTLVWFVSPMAGFKVSLVPANIFFKLQMSMLMGNIKNKLNKAKEGTRFVVPVVFGNGECSALSIPTQSMHKTYLIVEKKNQQFNLYWVNRPDVTVRIGLDSQSALAQIKSMLDERFPFMDMDRMMNYPVRSDKPKFDSAVDYTKIANQGNITNCVVSNLFGMLETLDKIQGEDDEISQLRYKAVREILAKRYNFYKDGFYPFPDSTYDHSIDDIWANFAATAEAAI